MKFTSVTKRPSLRPLPSTTGPRGFVLAVVTITIVLLTVAAYNYSGTMLAEHEVAVMGGRDLLARTAAESAIEYAATRILERDSDTTINLYNDPDVFRGRLLADSTVDRGRVRWTIVAIDETNAEAPIAYDPTHPYANAEGYVTRPVVDLAGQMADLIAAQRAYQANLSVVRSGREAYESAMRLGK